MNIVFFDTECLLCSKAVSFIYKRDKKEVFYFSSMLNERVNDLKYKDVDSIIYIKDTKEFIYSDAVIEILNDLGGFYKVFKIFRIIPEYFRDGLYKLIAKNRKKFFAESKNCALPIKGLYKRML